MEKRSLYAVGMPSPGCQCRSHSTHSPAAPPVLFNEGGSYRHASQQARIRAQAFQQGPNGTLIASRDGRLAADWVSQYAPILAEEFLPTVWPEVLVLDHLPFHLRARAGGQPKQSGRVGFHVFAALSYGDGTVAEAKRHRRTPMLWRLGAFKAVSQASWEDFFAQLPGNPVYVVCDRQSGMLNALAKVWPATRVYPCTQHLRMNVEEILRMGALVHEKTFVRRQDYDALVAEVDRLHRDREAWEVLSKDKKEGANRLDAWLTTNGTAIEKSISEPHAWARVIRRQHEPFEGIRPRVGSLTIRFYALADFSDVCVGALFMGVRATLSVA
jgi:hypothetical protein